MNEKAVTRPEWVKCVLVGKYVEGTDRPIQVSWCGRDVPPFEFAFMDASHAALAARENDRLVPCPECCRAVCYVLAPSIRAEERERVARVLEYGAARAIELNLNSIAAKCTREAFLGAARIVRDLGDDEGGVKW